MMSNEDWPALAEGYIQTMAESQVYFCSPEKLLDLPYYRERPEAWWLGNFLWAMEQLQHLVRLGAKRGMTSPQVVARLRELGSETRACVDRFPSWVTEQLGRELEHKVGAYCSRSWIKAIEDGLQHEMWYVLNERDKIEAVMRAHELLHPRLVPDPELVRRVTETDAILRDVGPRLWAIDAPSGYSREERVWHYPCNHWWWWLDEPGIEDGTSQAAPGEP